MHRPQTLGHIQVPGPGVPPVLHPQVWAEPSHAYLFTRDLAWYR